MALGWESTDVDGFFPVLESEKITSPPTTTTKERAITSIFFFCSIRVFDRFSSKDVLVSPVSSRLPIGSRDGA